MPQPTVVPQLVSESGWKSTRFAIETTRQSLPDLLSNLFSPVILYFALELSKILSHKIGLRDRHDIPHK
jgi:hypothetical protein